MSYIRSDCRKILIMRNLVFVFIAAACAACLNVSGCASGEKLSGTERVKGYAVETDYVSLDISGAIKTSFSENADSVYVTADESVIDYVRVERKGNELCLYIKFPAKFRNWNYGDVTAVLPYSTSLERVDVSGASSLTSEKVFEAEKFAVDVTGASDFDAAVHADKVSVSGSGASSISCEVEAESLDVDLSGASDARLSGRAGTCSLTVSGASSLKGLSDFWIVTDYTSCDISGASSARIICNKSLSGEASGASTLVYSGDAVSEVLVSGASSVKKR